MRPVHAVRALVLIGLATVAGAAAAGDQLTVDAVPDRTSEQLIADLDSGNSTVRDDAIDRLVNRGRPGRAACRRALAGASPQQRIGLDRVLLHIPWTSLDDPPGVIQAFQNYPVLSAQARQDQLVGTLRPLGGQALPAWLRVLRRDPSTSVRWEAARYVRFYIEDDDEAAKRLVGLTSELGGAPAMFDDDGEDVLPIDQNYPLLAVAGWAVAGTDAARATELIKRAIDAEKGSPSAFDGQADFAYAWLVDRATRVRDFNSAVKLYRQQAASADLWADAGVDQSVGELIANQCAYGPFPGFADDLRAYQSYLLSPEFLYSLGHLAERRHQPAAAALARRVALLSGGSSVESHFAVGLFLYHQHWDDAAEREFNRCLELPDVSKFTINWNLKNVALDRDDDLAAGKYLEAALADLKSPEGITMTDQFGKPSAWNTDLAWAQVHCHYIRAARWSGDTETARQRLEKWLEIDQEKHVLVLEPSMAADVVPVLDSLGRKTEADRIFDTAYELLHARVTQFPEDSMSKNNLAWLLVETGRHPEEAVRLANAAAAADPYDADVLDTQAEAVFNAGRKKEAAEIETRAAGYKPQSRMIAEKAARYRKAAGI